jgi:mevalonate kinase
MEDSEFYSNGKLLLTGEYVVLDGAIALAFPCKFGQSLNVKKNNAEKYTWTSYLKNGEVWQKVTFTLDDVLKNRSQTDFEKRLFQILKVIYELKPKIFNDTYDFWTKLDFEKDWGLGSSSTLINNISQWANIDAYKLLDRTFGGSGYDIAAASMQSPFIYQRIENKVFAESVKFSNELKPHLFFVYLNQKQNSRKAVENYRKINQIDNSKTINQINEITQSIIQTRDLKTFEDLLQKHENIIGELIKLKTIKQQKFNDYDAGIIKSLGAWGGDFVLVTARQKNDLDYFIQKGYKTIFSYNQMLF